MNNPKSLIRVKGETCSPQEKYLKLIDEAGKKILNHKGDYDFEGVSSYLKNHRFRLAHDMSYAKNFNPKNGIILEIGAIPLFLNAAIRQSGGKIMGVDIAPERYRHAIIELGLTIIKSNIEICHLPFRDNTFELILLNEVFEHLRIDLIFTLKEILRVLKPNGVLMLSTPNLRSLKGITNILFHQEASACSAEIFPEYQKLKTVGHMGHVREYTALEVCKFLKAMRFKSLEVIYRGTYPHLWQRILSRLKPHMRPYMTIVATKD